LSDKKFTVATHGERIREFLNRILQLAHFRVKFELTDEETPHPEFENPDIRVKFTGPDVELLLENKAELLLALELLTMEALRMGADDHSRLSFDANDHRMLRIEELRASAIAAAERVKNSHSPFRFNPMNSRERRILHLALREETAVRSESEGFEPRRNVVIYPAGMPSQPQPAAPPPYGRPSSGDRRSSGGGRPPGGRGGERRGRR
jgi:spoIIIJ-associated protein